jgi:hypothetical protein
LRTPHNEEFCDLYSLPNIRAIRLRIMRRVWKRGEVCAGFLWENVRERDDLEDVGVDGRIILKWIMKWHGGVDWIDVAHDRVRWRTVLNAVMNVKFP